MTQMMEAIRFFLEFFVVTATIMLCLASLFGFGCVLFRLLKTIGRWAGMNGER